MQLILNKYIIDSPVETGNYFPIFQVTDERGETYYAQRLIDIPKKSTVVKDFLRKLKFLKRSEHLCLPEIIEYGWEESESSYFIIHQVYDAPWMESKFEEISPKAFLAGIKQLIDCLQYLLVEHRITHGDITPADIFIDDKSNFRIVNFGLSDLAETNNTTREISDFTDPFVAPEKRDAQQAQGFPFQKDVYSIGKIIDWYFSKKETKNTPEVEILISSLCEDIPQNRPT